MRTVIIFCLLLSVFATVCNASEDSGFVFGIKPGNMINSAYFGLKIGSIVPMISADLIWLSASATYTSEELNSYVDYDGALIEYRNIDTQDMDGRAFLLIPSLGGKLYLGDQDVRPYLHGNLFLSLPSVKAESKSRNEYYTYRNGVLVDHRVDTDEEDLSKEDEELVRDVLSFWGITLGVGAEYFFGDHFSVGGEYGIRLLFDGVNQETTDEHGDGESAYVNQVDNEVSASVKVSYAVVSLNFHF